MTCEPLLIACIFAEVVLHPEDMPPKRGPTAVGLFNRKYFSELDRKISGIEDGQATLREAARAWRELSEAEQQVRRFLVSCHEIAFINACRPAIPRGSTGQKGGASCSERRMEEEHLCRQIQGDQPAPCSQG